MSSYYRAFITQQPRQNIKGVLNTTAKETNEALGFFAWLEVVRDDGVHTLHAAFVNVKIQHASQGMAPMEGATEFFQFFDGRGGFQLLQQLAHVRARVMFSAEVKQLFGGLESWQLRGELRRQRGDTRVIFDH